MVAWKEGAISAACVAAHASPDRLACPPPSFPATAASRGSPPPSVLRALCTRDETLLPMCHLLFVPPFLVKAFTHSFRVLGLGRIASTNTCAAHLACCRRPTTVPLVDLQQLADRLQQQRTHRQLLTAAPTSSGLAACSSSLAAALRAKLR